jgi:hypothetical protein
MREGNNQLALELASEVMFMRHVRADWVVAAISHVTKEPLVLFLVKHHPFTAGLVSGWNVFRIENLPGPIH